MQRSIDYWEDVDDLLLWIYRLIVYAVEQYTEAHGYMPISVMLHEEGIIVFEELHHANWELMVVTVYTWTTFHVHRHPITQKQSRCDNGVHCYGCTLNPRRGSSGHRLR